MHLLMQPGAYSCEWLSPHPQVWTCLQVNGHVQGAALMFQNLHTVVLRRATHLNDRALAALAAANGPRLKVHNAVSSVHATT